MIGYVFQAALGLILLGIAAVSPNAAASTATKGSIAARSSQRPPTSARSHGPSLP